MKYAETNRKLFSHETGRGYQTVQVKSKSNPEVKYTVDVTNGRCSCPAWVFQKGGWRKPCKHLVALGFHELANPYEPMDVQEPKSAQRATVKEIA